VPPPRAPGGGAARRPRLDGVCLSGGPDVDPGAYGEREHDELGPTEPDLDRAELAVARSADARGIPILAICRGAQVMNIARGGTLHQHVPDLSDAVVHRDVEDVTNARHEIRIEPGTLLANVLETERAEVNSFHHQAIAKLGDGLRAVAWSEDGLIEAVEDPARSFLLGVQWHAEGLTDRPEGAALFRSFVEAAVAAGSLR
jgi:putative glutamine amidotransferase